MKAVPGNIEESSEFTDSANVDVDTSWVKETFSPLGKDAIMKPQLSGLLRITFCIHYIYSMRINMSVADNARCNKHSWTLCLAHWRQIREGSTFLRYGLLIDIIRNVN